MFPSSTMIRWFRALDDQTERALKWLWRHRKLVGAMLAVMIAAWAIGATQEAEPEADRIAQVGSSQEGLKIDQIVNRLWVDHLPRSKDDKMRMYFLLKKEGVHPLGVHITFHSMAWRVQEFFLWKAEKGRLEFQFFDPEVKARTGGKCTPVKGDEHFDMQLALEGDPQAKGAPFTYFRLKEKGAVGGLPTEETLSGLLASMPVP